MSRFTIHDLASTIDARAASGGEGSYTRKLLDKGAEHCAKKLGEEAVETVIAAVENDRGHLIAESADLLFHLLVLLKRSRPRWRSGRRCRGLRKRRRASATDRRGSSWISGPPNSNTTPTASSPASSGRGCATT